ncbi:LptF/LptG family permease [Eisenibacter elegans]|uniref:LptF/LptG family permease n=1 Tax=Eisenibacter elegans TaxID=997 RepID=UPI00316AE609
MMKLLDRYILFKYLTTFVFVVVLLIAVLVVIDMTEKIEDFSRMPISSWQIFEEYYLNFIPYYANMLSPIIVFIAAVFVTARLASHTEIIAMVASGISLLRLLRPYFIGSSMIAVLVFFLINWVIPKANKIRINFENTYIKDKYYFNQRNVHFRIGPTTYAYFESYDNTAHVGYRFTLEEINGLDLEQKLESPKISWNAEKGKWTMEEYKLRTIKNDRESVFFGRDLDTALNIKPKDFESKYMLNEQLTLTELNAYIDEMMLRGADDMEVYIIERYERFTYPFAIIILTIIGVIVSARKTREGSGVQIAFGFVLAFVYVLFIILSRNVGKQGNIPPLLAAWMPNIIFCIIGYVMYRRIPK